MDIIIIMGIIALFTSAIINYLNSESRNGMLLTFSIVLLLCWLIVSWSDCKISTTYHKIFTLKDGDKKIQFLIKNNNDVKELKTYHDNCEKYIVKRTHYDEQWSYGLFCVLSQNSKYTVIKKSEMTNE